MSCLTMIGDAKENDSNFLLKIKFFRFEALFSGKTSLKYFQVQLKLTIYWLDTAKHEDRYMF